MLPVIRGLLGGVQSLIWGICKMTDTFRVTLECNELKLVQLIRSGLIENAKIESVGNDKQPAKSPPLLDVNAAQHRISRWDVYRNITDHFSDDTFTVENIKDVFSKQKINAVSNNISAFLCHLTAMGLVKVVDKIGKKNVFRLKRKIGQNKFMQAQRSYSVKQNARYANGR